MKNNKKESGEIIVKEETSNEEIDNMKNGEFVIQIKGEIGFEITAESVNKQLEKADGQDVVIEVASPGGSVFEGVEIFNAIRDYKGKTEARILGMAASMASYIPLATNKVLAEDNATYMIHNAWGMVIGDADEMKSEAEILESINSMIAREYVNKTGKSEKEILKMMADESWFFGEEIKDAGFIDGIIVHKDSDKKDKKKDKETTLAEARNKFKSTLSKIKEGQKPDFDKMKSILSNLNLKKATQGGKMKNISKFEKWSIEYKDNLPDSAFAVIIKQSDKKVRKLAYKDKDGKVDVPHLRNALKRLTMGKIKLSQDLRSKAMGILKAVAKKYIKENKTTKSGKIMSELISKFGTNAVDKLKAIIQTLKDKAENRKPTDEIYFDVKTISLLIEDLEDVVEANTEIPPEETEEKSEEKEEKEEKEEEAEEEKETEEKEEKKEKKNKGKEKEDEQEESKFKEAMKVAEGYKTQLEKSEKMVSKFEGENTNLKKEKEKLTQAISKFQKVGYIKLLNSTVEKVSKFKNLNEKDKLALKETYLISKMSESALEEVGRITENEMFSKLEEPKETTKPSDQLEPAEEEQNISKMSGKDKLDALAELNAKQKGFVG